MTTTTEALELPELAPNGFNLEITPEERAAIGNDGVCLSLLYYFRTRDVRGRHPGGFVYAVLTNDFLRALNNRGVSWEAVDTIRLILNGCPAGAFGSKDKFDAWTWDSYQLPAGKRLDGNSAAR